MRRRCSRLLLPLERADTRLSKKLELKAKKDWKASFDCWKTGGPISWTTSYTHKKYISESFLSTE
jgi:hypothetical protein